MPQIPRIKQTVAMPAGTGAVPFPERPLAEPYTQEAKSWADMGQAADLMVRLVKADNLAKRHEARTDLHLLTAQIEDEFSQRTDYDRFHTDLRTRQEQTLRQLQQKYGPAFDVIEPEVQRYFGVQEIQVGHLARKAQIKGMTATWLQRQNDLATLIGRTPVAADREEYLREYSEYTDSLVRTGVIDAVQAEKGLQTMRSRSSMTAFRFDATRNLDEAERRLTAEREVHYPHMTPEDELRAGQHLESRRKEMDRRAAAERRETHNTFAKEAYDRRRAWKAGKSPDGVPFSEWLFQARDSDLISEGTYQMHMNAVERAADRAASGERKMTAADWISFGKIKAEFMKPGSEMGWDDIGQLSGRFPNSRISELVNIVARQPSAERKALISSNWQYVNKRLSEGKASADVWKETNDKWNTQLDVTADKDIPALARELVKEIPQGGFSPMLDELRKQKQAERNRPGFFQSLFRFNPSTQQLEQGGKR